MDIELIIQSVENNKAYEISQLTTEISWTTDIGDQPGKLEVEFLPDANIFMSEGDLVRMKFEGRNIFYGKLFKKGKNESTWSFMAYDNKRYLQNEDTLVFGASRSDERFLNICKISGIPGRVRDKSNYRLPNVIHDAKSYYAMLDEALGHTLINGGMWYIIRDNFGTLEHIALNSLITDYVIGDQSLATSFEFESSIEESYNLIKLTRDNEETNKRDVYIVKNSNLVRKWGTLQYYESVSEDMNPAQIKAMANNIMKSLGKPERTLKVESIGVKEISAGNSVVIQLQDLADEGYDKPKLAVVENCVHTWSKTHDMSLRLRVV